MKLTEKHWNAARQLLPQNAEALLLNGQFKPWFLPGDKLVFVKESWEKKQKISRYMLVDCETGLQSELFDHRKLRLRLGRIGKAPGEGKPLELTPLCVEPDGAVQFLLPDGEQYRFDGARLQRMRKAPPAGASLSPDRRYAINVRRHNLHLYDMENGLSSRITKDGREHNGYGERIEGDTFFIRHRLEGHTEPAGVDWSPDSRHFLTYRIDEREVRPLHLVQSVPAQGMRPVLHEYRYALPGEPEPQCSLYVGSAETGAVRAVQCPPAECAFLPPTSSGYGMLCWSQEGKSAAFCRMGRDHLSAEIMLIDPETGAVTPLFTESAEGFLFFDFHRFAASHQDRRDSLPPFMMLSDSLHSLFFLSERDGFMHIYRYDTQNPGQYTQLTQGEFTVCQLLYLDAGAGRLYFTACGREINTRPYQRYLYSVDVHSGEVTLLSREKGDHCIFFSPDGRWYTDTVSACDEPQSTALCRTSDAGDGQPVPLCACDDSRLVRAGMTYPIFFTEKGADGTTDITGVLIMPSRFDAGKKYPVVDYYYGGNQTVNQPNTFWDYLHTGFVASLSQLQCACVIIDGRGTPLRGRAYHQHCLRNMGDCAGLADHAAVIRRLCEKYSFMDGNRVGVWGHSGGGFGTLHCMTKEPGLYKVGVATGGNHYQELYNADWSERFMAGFDAQKLSEQSAGPLVKNLEGKLLLIHGELDDNVHPANTMRVVDELIRADKDFDMLIIPNRHHQLRDMPYYQRRVLEYLALNLHALPKK